MSRMPLSALSPDLNDIIRLPYDYKDYFLINAVLHTVHADINEGGGIYVSSMLVNRDYVNTIGENIEIDLTCLLGTFVYDVYPYADDLELTLTITKQQRQGSEAYVNVERYKAIYTLEGNQSPSRAIAPRELLNQEPPVTIRLQLVDKSLLTLRILTTQGAFSSHTSTVNHDMSSTSLIRSIISHETQGVLIDNRPSIERVDIEDTDNTNPFQTVVIPSGTRVIDVPEFIHSKKGGVYNAGINSFYQKFAVSESSKTEKVVFVYSLMNGEKYHTADNKIMFFVAPSSEWNTVPCTYKYNARNLRVMTNPVASLADMKDALTRSHGGGFRSASADSFTRTPITVTPEGPVFKKTELMTEVINKIQPDGLNFAPHKGIEQNHFQNTTEVLARKGTYIKLCVDNLDMDYFYPGAGCMVYYETANGLVQELNGVIHRAIIRLQPKTGSPNEEFNKLSHALFSTIEFDVFITGPDVEEDTSGLNYF